MLKPILSSFMLLFALTACGDETLEKGEEEQALSGGKADSFFKPTNHGAVQFGVPSRASISSDEKFHAWTFTLSDDAKVVLKTTVSTNLDTVMYLYRRDNTSDSWGRYIKKNDDHKGNIWSQITLSGEAAEYRVIVKPFKKALKGSFSLDATCKGAGCKSTNPQTNQCVAGTFDSPEGMDFTDVCSTKILALLRSPSISVSSGSVPLKKHCELNGVKQLAVAHYADYFSEIGNLEDIFYFGQPVEFEFTHATYKKGHRIDVDGGGDENGMSLFYDNDLKLLALFQHNQTPDVQFFCGEAGDTKTQAEPFPGCMESVLFSTPKTNTKADDTLKGKDTLENIESLGLIGITDIAADFLKTYKSDLKDDTKINYKYAHYKADYNDEVGVTTLSFGNKKAVSYTAYSDYNGVMLVRSSGGKDTINCEK